MAHPVKRRAQVVDQFLARGCAAHVCGQFSGLSNVRVSGFHPQEVGIGRKFPGALGGGGEACAVVVEAFTGSGAVAGPDNGSLGVVIRQVPPAGDGQVRVLLDLFLVGIPSRLRGTFGLEMGVDSY